MSKEPRTAYAVPSARAHDTKATDQSGSSNESNTLTDLVAQAGAFLASGDTVDRAWTNAAARYLVRLIADGNEPGVVGTQDAFRQLAAAARRTRKAQEDKSASLRTPPDALTAAAAHSLEQFTVLLSVADAGAALIRPREAGRKISWGTIPARILLALSSDRPTANEELLELVDTTDTQLSRACRALADQGLITRRSYGKKVAWLLSSAGMETAATIARLDPAIPPVAPPATPTTTHPAASGTTAIAECTVWADALGELERAASRAPQTIAVMLGAVGAASTRRGRTTDPHHSTSPLLYRRTEDVDSIGSQHLHFRDNPSDVLFMPEQGAAYLLQNDTDDEDLEAAH